MVEGHLKKLFVAALQEMLGADRQLLKAFPRLTRAATHRDLKKFCREGVDYTAERIARLERSLRLLGTRPHPHRSPAMDGLIKEATEAVHCSTVEDCNAAILGAVQKISHYGRAGYWTLCAYAEALAENKAKALLMKSLREKEEAIHDMMRMAESDIVPRMVREDKARQDRARAKPTAASGSGRPRRSRAA